MDYDRNFPPAYEVTGRKIDLGVNGFLSFFYERHDTPVYDVTLHRDETLVVLPGYLARAGLLRAVRPPSWRWVG